MSNGQGGNSGMAFIVGGLVVAVGVMAYFMSGGTFWMSAPSGPNVTIETPTIVVPAAE